MLGLHGEFDENDKHEELGYIGQLIGHCEEKFARNNKSRIKRSLLIEKIFRSRISSVTSIFFPTFFTSRMAYLSSPPSTQPGINFLYRLTS